MAPKKEEKKGGPLGMIAAIIVAVIMFMSLVLEAVATPFDVLKLNDTPPNQHKECYSVWGRKQCGGTHASTWHDELYHTCGVFEAVMKAAASFSCISLFAIGISLILDILFLVKFLKSKVPVMLFLFFAIIASSVPWACIAGLYHNPTCSYGRFSDHADYAAGFGLYITAWGLTIVGFIFMILA